MPRLTTIMLFILIASSLSYSFAVGPKHWDDLLYMHTAWNMQAMTHILNRYLTIYLLGLFNSLADGDPFLAAKYLGTFTFFTTISLVFINTMMLTQKNRVFSSVTAVSLLLSFPLFTHEFGIVIADYTVTMMILFGVFIFISYLNSKSKHALMLFAFGMVMFLAIKAKETGALLSVLIPGFFIENGGFVNTKAFRERIIFLLLGFCCGIVLFVFLNLIFLKAPLFGLQLSDIQSLLAFNTKQGEVKQDIENNFLSYMAPSGVFIISVLAVADSGRRIAYKWIWLLILLIICFLNVSTINGGWQIVPRYATPAIALLALIAPQIIAYEDAVPSPTDRRQIYLLWISIPLAAIAAALMYRLIAKPAGLNYEYFFSGVVAPTIICLILGATLLKRSQHFLPKMILAILIYLLTLPTIFDGVLFIASKKSERLNRFAPFLEFKESIQCGNGRILISGTIYQQYKMLSRDASSSLWMFDLFFRCHSNASQFDYANNKFDLEKLLSENSYQYVFFEKKDIDTVEYVLSKNNKNYELKKDNNRVFYLLSSKDLNN